MKCRHMISRDRDHLRGGGWGSTAVWNLSENSSVLVAWPVPYNAMLFQEEGCGEGGKERKTFWQRLVGRRRQWYNESLKEIEKKKGKTRGRRAVFLSFTVSLLQCSFINLWRQDAHKIPTSWQKVANMIIIWSDHVTHMVTSKCYVSHDVSHNTLTNRSSTIISIALFTLALAIPKVKISKLEIARERISKRSDFPKEYLQKRIVAKVFLAKY